MTWTLTIPEVPPSGNVVKRMHWARYSQLLARWFWLIRAADGFGLVRPPNGKRKLVITRYGTRPLDRDNLYASVKPVVDVLRPQKREEGIYSPKAKRAGEPWTRTRIGHGLILEDDSAHLELQVRQEPLPKGAKPRLEIKLEDFPVP